MDIYDIKSYVVNELTEINGVIGTGINHTNNSIIIYVNLDDNSHVIDEVYNKIGTQPYGHNLQFITTGKLKFL